MDASHSTELRHRRVVAPLDVRAPRHDRRRDRVRWAGASQHRDGDAARARSRLGVSGDRRAAALNRRLRYAGLPVQVANLSSIWTICYTRPSAYNWMFQYYLRAEGLALSWVGTGRLILSDSRKRSPTPFCSTRQRMKFIAGHDCGDELICAAMFCPRRHSCRPCTSYRNATRLCCIFKTLERVSKIELAIGVLPGEAKPSAARETVSRNHRLADSRPVRLRQQRRGAAARQAGRGVTRSSPGRGVRWSR